jgi:hypothetical protein
MKQTISISLILGFLFVDFLFFHDIFKPGEVITPAQYLTGLLSFPAIVIFAKSLLKTQHKH